MTPARAREAVVQALEPYELTELTGIEISDLHQDITKLLTRAVARERAAWKAAVKRLEKETYQHARAVAKMKKPDSLSDEQWNNTRHGVAFFIVGKQSMAEQLLDLLQRRGNRGGKT